MKFLDQAKIYVRSGDGGDGVVSFRREKYVEYGGPNGGNGGRGGDIIFRSVANLNTLIDFRYTQHFKAKKGGNGGGSERTGKAAEDIIINVPIGTQILDENKEEILADFTEADQTMTLCRGGDGGFGNTHYKSSTNRAPRRADKGYPGEEKWVWLRLKLLADVGLVGLPNAGKSTLLSASSRAKPKIADYPFTTLHPQLGLVRTDMNKSFVMADIPGLIEGASEGNGLGDRFLGHVERCAILIHLIDATEADPVANWKLIRKELKEYDLKLSEKEELIVLNKIDAVPSENLEKITTKMKEASGQEVYAISAATGLNIQPLLYTLQEKVDLFRQQETPLSEETETLEI